MRVIQSTETPERLEEANSSGDDSASSDGSFSDSLSNPRRKAIGIALGSLMVAGVALVCLFTVAENFGPKEPAFGSRTLGVIETAEFKGLLKAQARDLMEHAGATPAMEKHLDTAIGHAHTFLLDHLSVKQVETLRKARLGAQGWNDLKMLCRALNDTRVQGIGRMILHETKQNVLSGPAEIGAKIAQQLKGNRLHALSEEVLPSHLRAKLRQRWQNLKQPSADQVWRMMLDPTGETFTRLRSNTSATATVPARYLRSGSWEHPKLNGWELASGITSLVFITAAEITLHIDLLVPGLEIPMWVHAMLFIPGDGLGTFNCVVGLSFWCDYFLGALGLNALDAVASLADLLPK